MDLLLVLDVKARDIAAAYLHADRDDGDDGQSARLCRKRAVSASEDWRGLHRKRNLQGPELPGSGDLRTYAEYRP